MEHIPTPATTKGPADWSSGDVYLDPSPKVKAPPRWPAFWGSAQIE